MKIFIQKLFFFLLIFLLIIILFQTFISYKKHIQLDYGKGVLEKSNGANAALLLFGSSRCWMHLQPSFFKSTFNLNTVNLGVNGHSEISMMQQMIDNYFSRNKTIPKYAIICLDPFVTAGNLNNNENYFIKDVFAPYAFLPNKIDTSIVNYFCFNWKEKYIPLYATFRYNYFFKALTGENIQPPLANGFDIYQEVWDTIARPVERTGKYTPKLSSIDTSSIEKALITFTNLLKKKNIKILCLQLPVHESIYDTATFNICKNMCERNKIPFVDLCNPNIVNDISNFYNSNHLNKKGIFSINKVMAESITIQSFLKQ